MLASDNNSSIPAHGDFSTSTVLYTSGANPSQLGEPLEIRLLHIGSGSAAATEIEFDDVSIGFGDSAPAVVVGLPRFRSNGAASLELQGQPGSSHHVEVTENFGTWNRIGTVTLPASGVVLFNHAGASTMSQAFYRTVQVE